MKLGVVSDTHGHVENTQRAIRVLESLEIDVVLHAGDIGSASVISLFAAWPTHFIFGNGDYDEVALRQAIEQAGHTCHGRFGSVELAGRKIAFLHGDNMRRLKETIGSGEWDLVCYGHTHVAEEHMVGQTRVLNPGALYRANPHTFAVVELPSLEVTHVRV